MLYYRYTELENDLEVQEFKLFGFYAFNKRFGMTYEIPVAKQVDYSDVSAYKRATAGGCPPGAGSGNLPPIGVFPGGGGGLPLSDLDCDGEYSTFELTATTDYIITVQLPPGYGASDYALGIEVE